MPKLTNTLLGRQSDGSSPSYTKGMALEAKTWAVGPARITTAADIGAGSGELCKVLAGFCDKVVALDWDPPKLALPNVASVAADLNERFPLPDGSVSFVFSLEVVEHLENPRHFFREVARVMSKGAFGFVTTPNNHSWASKFTFLVRGTHRRFQDASYPAHLTPLLRCDFERILNEVGLKPAYWVYSNEDTLPLLHWKVGLPGRLFSDSVGVLFTKPE